MTGRVTSGFAPPDQRVFKYDEILPNVGFVYDFTPRISVFANYAKGLSVPSTDNLYNAFFFPEDTEQAKPEPETTDSFDVGVRYRSTKIQAQLGGWIPSSTNRTASAFDPELNASVFRNLGKVDKWGIDGSVAYEPIRQLTLYAFGSWNKSKIKDNIQIGSFGLLANDRRATTSRPGHDQRDHPRSCAFTAGKREVGVAEIHVRLLGAGHARTGRSRRDGQADRSALRLRQQRADLQRRRRQSD